MGAKRIVISREALDVEEPLSQIIPLREMVLTPATLQSSEFSERYQALTALIKQLTEIKAGADEALKEMLRAQYEETNDASVAVGDIKYTYIPATTCETFDSKRFKDDHPDEYLQYVKVGTRSDSLRVYAKKPAAKNSEDA